MHSFLNNSLRGVDISAFGNGFEIYDISVSNLEPRKYKLLNVRILYISTILAH